MIEFQAMQTDAVRALQHGGKDVYGHVPERAISDGDGVPSRHCLRYVAKDEPYLILAHRPFSAMQPYAETGPIFLCAEECKQAAPSNDLPEILANPTYIARGYDSDERIVSGTGGVVDADAIKQRATDLLASDRVKFVHVRSSQNNCFLVRVDQS